MQFHSVNSLRVFFVSLLFLACFATTGHALVAPHIVTSDRIAAADRAADADRIAQLEKQVAENKASSAAAAASAAAATATAQSAGDNAWVLTSALLVLMMTGPGLALFYSGLVRKKNVLGTMMQSFAMMGLVTILWAVVGYSLAFGHGNAFIGGFEHLFLRGVGLTPNTDYAATIPEQTYMVYQLMFAIITPALITGAFSERVKFSSMAVFLSAWSLLVYSPMAHMVWGAGGFLNSTGGRFPLPLVPAGLQSHGPHGLGRGRSAQRQRRPHPQPGFRGRHRRPHHLRCLSPRLRPLARQTHRLPAGADQTAQPGSLHRRRMSSLGGLVRL